MTRLSLIALLIGIAVAVNIPGTAGAQNTPAGREIIARMYHRYAGKWYHSFTFDQTTEVYRNDNRIGVQFIKEIDEELLHTIVRSDYFTGGVSNKPKQDDRRYMVGVEKAGVGSALS